MQQSNLNLIPSGDMPVIYASQYDKNRVIRFNLFDGDDEYTLAGTETVKCNIRKNDEHIVVIIPTIGANKYIDIALTEQACACFGDNIGEITISDDADTLIGTINFILKVERNPIQGGVTSASDIADLESQIEEIVHEVMTDDYYTRDEVDAKLDLKANSSDVYTKSEVDTALASKANASDVYTKSQVDTALGLKADKSDTYTKAQVDTALALKADASSVYTKSEVDTALALKADATSVYTKTEVDEMIDELYPVNTASGSIANFTTSLAKPLTALSSTIVAQQSGTGTPSPSNPRAISGWDSITLTHEYNVSDSETKTIALGQTVYGGVLDAKNGKLRVTWGSSDLGSLNWTRDAESVPSNPYFFSQKNITKTSTPNVLCSIYQVSNTSVANMPNYSIKADGNGRIIVINQDYTDASSFKTAMAGIIVVYELATPVEIDITANNFTTINGVNNIFSDCGDVTVGFKQGIQEYIDSKVGG